MDQVHPQEYGQLAEGQQEKVCSCSGAVCGTMCFAATQEPRRHQDRCDETYYGLGCEFHRQDEFAFVNGRERWRHRQQ